jgi:hypothetical protein
MKGGDFIMSRINRMIAKEMAKSGGKVTLIHGNVIGNINPLIEWIKWLNYEPEFEKIRMEYLDTKKVSELTLEELEEASKYIRNRIFARLFKIYGTKDCSEEDYMRVYDYMTHESINELMLSKLTSEELKYAKEKINYFSQISFDELNVKVKNEKQPEIYAELSMADSYVLHVISDINYKRNISKLEKEIDVQIKRNDVIRQKSLINSVN